ncbi:MAG TPA: HEAT repeat domain-containing protein [Planctomycetota bacterium]
MTEIEIRDPDAPGTAPAADEPAPESPYKNLLVPLVVVPALIVMVLVLVFVLFGAVAGEEDSPRQNLDRLLNGGFNERKQAAFNLVRQVLEHEEAVAAERAPEWEIDASFLPELRAARESIGELAGPKDVAIPLVLSSLLAQLGDPAGVEQLCAMTRLAEPLDPEREYRLYAAMTLGAIGPRLAERERALAAETLIALLDGDDSGLVLVAIAGLQNLPSPATVPALAAMLARSALELRVSAALSLAALGDAAAVPVLREALAPEPYAAERAASPRKWPPQRVSESRVKALEALARLGQAPARAALEELAEQDADPNVKRAARALLAAPGGG